MQILIYLLIIEKNNPQAKSVKFKRNTNMCPAIHRDMDWERKDSYKKKCGFNNTRIPVNGAYMTIISSIGSSLNRYRISQGFKKRKSAKVASINILNDSISTNKVIYNKN